MSVNHQTIRARSNRTRSRIRYGLFGAAAVLAASQIVSAATTWNWSATAGGSTPWTTGTNWSGGTAPGSVAGDTVNFTDNITAATTVTMSANETMGFLNVGDSTTPFVAFTIGANGGSQLIFDNSGSGSQLNKTGSGTTAADVIAAPVVIAGSAGLTLSNSSGSLLTVSGGITSTGSNSNLVINANGAGGITLQTTLVNNSGTITDSGAGAGTVTFSSGIGTNVTGLIENSNGPSIMQLGGTLTFTSSITIKNGTVQSNATTNLFGNGGTIFLGDATTTATGATLKYNGTNAAIIASNPITVGAATVGTLSITDNSIGFTLSGPVTLNNGSNPLTINPAGAGQIITLSGALSGSGAITTSGSIVAITDNNVGDNFANFTGNVSVSSSGILRFTDGALGNVGTITIPTSGNGGAVVNSTLQFAVGNTNTHDISSRLRSAGTAIMRLDVNGNSVLFGNPLTAANLVGTTSGISVIVESTAPGGTLTLSNVNSYNNGTQIYNGATLVLGNDAQLTGIGVSSGLNEVPAYVLARPGATFGVTSTDGSTTVRTSQASGTFAQSVITLAGGTFTDTTVGNNLSPTDDMGLLDLGTSYSFGSTLGFIAGMGYADTISITPGTGTSNPVLNFTSVRRFAGATVNFQGNGANDLTLGGTIGSTTPEIKFTAAAPTLVSGILPWATVGTPGANMTFATYDANGVRALKAGEMASSIAAGANSNVVLAGSDAASGPYTINSLQLNGTSSTLTVTGTLTIASGGVLNTGVGNTISGGNLDFGGNEAVFQNVGTGSTLNVTGTLQNYRGIDAPEGVTFSGSLVIQGQSILALSRTTSGSDPRAVNVTSNGGGITLFNNNPAGTTATENFSGNLILAAGSATDLNINSGTPTSSSVIQFNSFSPGASSVLRIASAFAFADTQSTSALTVGTATGVAKVTLANTPTFTGSQLTSGTSIEMLPNVFIGGGQGIGGAFATYDSNGFRSLVSGTDGVTTMPTSGVNTVNVITAAAATLTANTTINSLNANISGSIDLKGFALTVSSGGIMNNNGVNIGVTAGSTIIIPSNVTGYIINATSNGMTISAAITTTTMGMVFDTATSAGINLSSTANSWSGGTTVLASWPSGGLPKVGNLIISADNNLPSQAVSNNGTFGIVLNGGGLAGSATFNLNVNRVIGLGPTGAGNSGAGGLTSSSGTFTVDSLLENNTNGTGALFVDYTGNNSATAGTVVLTNSNNSYTGGTTVYGATLTVNVAGALSSGDVTVMPDNYAATAAVAGAATLNLGGNGAMSSTANLTVNGGVDSLNEVGTANIKASLAIGSLAGNPGLSGANVIITAGDTLTIGKAAPSFSSTFAGVISDTSATGGAVTKSGTSTQVFSGSNTYRGGTTITGGVLVAASANALGNGNVTVNGGTLELDPAVNLGASHNFVLTSGTLSFAPGTVTTDSLNSSGTGTFTLSDGTVVDLGLGPANSAVYLNSYAILNFGGGGTVGMINIIDYDTTDWTAAISNAGVLSFAAASEVPEPASLALLGLGAAGLLARRRRR